MKCKICNRKFKSLKGLRVHHTRIHKPTERATIIIFLAAGILLGAIIIIKLSA